jgi:hypothetical protein
LTLTHKYYTQVQIGRIQRERNVADETLSKWTCEMNENKDLVDHLHACRLSVLKALYAAENLTSVLQQAVV